MEAAFVEIGLEKNGFLYVDEIVGPELEGRKGARKIQDLIKRGQTILVQAVKDPMKSKGARLTTEISLPGRFLVYVPNGEGSGVSRRLEDAERTRLKEIVKSLDPEGRRDHRPNGRRGRVGRGHRARPRLPPAPLEDDPDEGEGRHGADARLRGGGASAAHRPRPLRRRLRRRADRRRSHAPADRQLPEEDLAAHGRARPSLSREGAALRGVGRRRGDPLDARAPRRPPLRRVPRLRLRGGVHRHRRQHRPLRRLARQERAGPARGHDREEQPRGGEGGRPPAPAPRHRRDHRHRLHRHGEPQEPRDGRGGAAQRARARPDEDVRRRDLAARARGDDAPERHGRPARDPHEPLSRLRRRRLRRLRRDAMRSRSSAGFATIAKGSRVQAFQVAVHPRVLLAARRVREERGSRRSRPLRDAGSSSYAAAENGHVHLDHFEVLAQGKLETLRPTAPVEEGRVDRAEARGGRACTTRPRASARSTATTRSSSRACEARRQEGQGDRRSRARRRRRTRRSPTAPAAPTPITFEAEAEKPTRAPRARRRPKEPDARGQLDADEASEPEDADCRRSWPRTGRRRRRGEAVEAQPTGRRRRSGRAAAPAAAGAGRRPAAATASARRPTDGRRRSLRTTDEPGAEDPRRRPRRAELPDDRAGRRCRQPAEPGRAGRRRRPRATPKAAVSDGQPKRKRSRRGSRGGRKRRKPARAPNGRRRRAAGAGPLRRRAPLHGASAESSSEPAGRGSRVRADVRVDRGLRRRDSARSPLSCGGFAGRRPVLTSENP